MIGRREQGLGLALVLAASGCAAIDEWKYERAQPYLAEIRGIHVEVHVRRRRGMTLQEAIELTRPTADGECASLSNAYLLWAEPEPFADHLYGVTWRCCVPGDECCFNPKKCEGGNDGQHKH